MKKLLLILLLLLPLVYANVIVQTNYTNFTVTVDDSIYFFEFNTSNTTNISTSYNCNGTNLTIQFSPKFNCSLTCPDVKPNISLSCPSCPSHPSYPSCPSCPACPTLPTIPACPSCPDFNVTVKAPTIFESSDSYLFMLIGAVIVALTGFFLFNKKGKTPPARERIAPTAADWRDETPAENWGDKGSNFKNMISKNKLIVIIIVIILISLIATNWDYITSLIK